MAQVNDADDPPGRAPSARTRALVEAAALLSPSNSLARVESTARGVIAGVAASAAVLTGFGVLSANDLLSAPLLLVPSVIASAVALALAAVALIPTMTQAHTGNLLQAHKLLAQELGRRGRLARWAAISLALSYALGVLPVIAIKPGRPANRASIEFTPGKRKDAVRVVIDLTSLSPGSSATLRVHTIAAKRKSQLASVTQYQMAERGAIRLSATVRRPRAGERMEARVTRTRHGESELISRQSIAAR